MITLANIQTKLDNMIEVMNNKLNVKVPDQEGITIDNFVFGYQGSLLLCGLGDLRDQIYLYVTPTVWYALKAASSRRIPNVKKHEPVDVWHYDNEIKICKIPAMPRHEELAVSQGAQVFGMDGDRSTVTHVSGWMDESSVWKNGAQFKLFSYFGMKKYLSMFDAFLPTNDIGYCAEALRGETCNSYIAKHLASTTINDEKYKAAIQTADQMVASVNSLVKILCLTKSQLLDLQCDERNNQKQIIRLYERYNYTADSMWVHSDKLKEMIKACPFGYYRFSGTVNKEIVIRKVQNSGLSGQFAGEVPKEFKHLR